MQITKTNQDGQVTFLLEGRLDTITSSQLPAELAPVVDAAQGDIVLDLSSLAYISSAGLRVLLAAQKGVLAKGISMTIRNVCPEVMEVFDMTGFTEILNIL